jgi:hypothetical protein
MIGNPLDFVVRKAPLAMAIEIDSLAGAKAFHRFALFFYLPFELDYSPLVESGPQAHASFVVVPFGHDDDVATFDAFETVPLRLLLRRCRKQKCLEWSRTVPMIGWGKTGQQKRGEKRESVSGRSKA